MSLRLWRSAGDHDEGARFCASYFCFPSNIKPRTSNMSSWIPSEDLATGAMTRNERYQYDAIIFLVQTIVISFTVFRTLI